MSNHKRGHSLTGTGVVITTASLIAFSAGIAAVAIHWKPMVTVHTTARSTSAGKDQLSWEQSHRSELLRLKSSADALAIQGHSREAHDAYQQCLTMIGGHPLTDPVLLNAATSAQENQDRLLEVLTNPQTTEPASTETIPASANLLPAPIAHTLLAALPSEKLAPAPPPISEAPGSNDPTPASPPQPARADKPSVTPGTDSDGKLFNQWSKPSTIGSSSRGGGSLGSPDTNLDPAPPPPDIFQPFANSDPRLVRQATATPTAPAQSPNETISAGHGPQHVWVILGSIDDEKGPVSGTVDGHPFTIGGPGQPNAVLFTGLPAGTLPIVIDGQHYAYNGYAIPFSLPNGDAPSSSSGQSATATATAPPRSQSTAVSRSARNGSTSGAASKGVHLQSAAAGW